MGSTGAAGGNRQYVYEVVGLSRNGNTESLGYSIRQSGSVFFTVSRDRMNQEMRRIARSGGRIVSIKPLDGIAPLPGRADRVSNPRSLAEQPQVQEEDP